MSAVLVKAVEPAVAKALLRVFATSGPPWPPAKRGRPPKRSPLDYAWAVVTRSFYPLSYREAAVFLKIPKSSLHWAFQKMETAFVQRLISIASKIIEAICNPDCAIMDSTGVGIEAHGLKNGSYRPYLKLHALAQYSRQKRAVWFAAAKVTAGNVPDVLVGYEFLSVRLKPSLLLADKGYDSFKLYRLAYKKRWRVCMRQRSNCEWNRGLRGRVLREYDDGVYKSRRSRVESLFGGFAKRYHSTVRERLWGTRERACLLWAAAHNLRTLARISRLLIYWTLPAGPW